MLQGDEPEPGEEPQHKAIDRAARRLLKHDRESRFLVKRSEDYDVIDNVFDLPTLKVISNMINDGIIKYVRGSLAAGKESKIYIAVAPDGSFLTLKIYLTLSAEFKNRMQYIAGDPRFSGIRGGTHNMITVWARKEFKNMQAALAAGVQVPVPIAVQKNVLVMEFVSDGEGNPAPPLVELAVTLDDYKQVMEQVSVLYQKAKLVHADLSEYNVFRSNKGIMLFDFGSAVDIQHPNSKHFLSRDVVNVNRFFEKRGIQVLEIAKALEKITGGRKRY
jgi:RIO kinase 1